MATSMGREATITTEPVAITGASGFLGRHLVAAARAVGMPIRLVVRRPDAVADLAGADTTVAKADLADDDALRRAFEGCCAVVSNAALLSWKGAPWAQWEEANVTGARRVAEAAVGAGISDFVHISSIAAVRPSLTGLNGADTPSLGESDWAWSFAATDPRYCWSKAMGERAVRTAAQQAGMRLSVLRPGPIVGSGDGKYTALLVRRAKQRLALTTGARVPHVHGRDVADAALAAIVRRAQGTWFTTGPSVSQGAALRALVSAGVGNCRVVEIPVPMTLRFDDGPAERDLGFRARSIEEAMAEVAAAR